MDAVTSEKPKDVEESAKKFDEGKPRMELIPWKAVEACSQLDVDENFPEDSRNFRVEIGRYLEGGPVEHLIRGTVILFNRVNPRSWWPVYVEIAKVLTYGAQKYAPHNWRKGGALTQGRTIGAALRHVAVDFTYDDTPHDPETGHPHYAHALCELLFAITYALEGRGDDRHAPSPDWVPKGTPWTYVTDGKNRKVAAWIGDGEVQIEDPEMPGCPWYWTPSLSPLDFTGHITPVLTPELSEQCRVFWEQHRPRKGSA